MDKVVALLCNYEHHEYIEQAYRSLINQSYENLEIIVIDDGSSVSFSAGCGTEYSFTPRMVSSATIYMHSGGGGDNHISWTCCGSSGWGIHYY